MNTWKITLRGIVQGVGLRPSLFRVAEQQHLFIHVANTCEGVAILFNAPTRSDAQTTLSGFLAQLPTAAKITSFSLDETSPLDIHTSSIFYPTSSVHYAHITPDRAWCVNCKTEFLDPTHRRHRFYFNSCSSCGARLSVVQTLPFEREHTSMKTYPMCGECLDEYHTLSNPRALTQLLSCKTCSYPSSLTGYAHTDTAQQLAVLAEKILQGEIVAIKSIGGFLFVCDDKQTAPIEHLRTFKKRPTKPFAIMAKDRAWVEEHFALSPAEREALLSPAAPIVLLTPKAPYLAFQTLKPLSGSSTHVGVMLASTPYFYELCDANGGSLLATSGNTAGLPIEFENKTAVQHLLPHTPYVWHYERPIENPQDDSVVSFTPRYHHKIILRRSRGLAPSLPELNELAMERPVLCLGAEQKSTICIAYKNQLLLSQYIGSLHTLENLERFQYTIQQYLSLSGIEPTTLVIDQHPQFHYRDILSSLPLKKDIPILEVPHHKAHFMALLGEKNRLSTSKKILGVVFDGMGYGEGRILGGEFFIYEHSRITEHFSLPFYKYVSGDKMSVTPSLCFFSVMQGHLPPRFEGTFSPTYLANLRQIYPQQKETNSVGRLFDALAFCLGFPYPQQSFEGEAALFLHPFFQEGYATYGDDETAHYCEHTPLEWSAVFQRISTELEQHIPKEKVAFQFLNTLVELILKQARAHNVDTLACTGGVFQNPYLVDLLLQRTATHSLELLLHECCSPNDENISLGQAFYFQTLA